MNIFSSKTKFKSIIASHSNVNKRNNHFSVTEKIQSFFASNFLSEKNSESVMSVINSFNSVTFKVISDSFSFITYDEVVSFTSSVIKFDAISSSAIHKADKLCDITVLNNKSQKTDLFNDRPEIDHYSEKFNP